MTMGMDMMTKTNNLESKIIILQTAIEVYKNGIEHIDQAINRIPNPMGRDDLDKICAEINRIREIISLTSDTLDNIADYANNISEPMDKKIYESADNLLKIAAEGEI